MVLHPDEGFLELHSRATEGEKDKIWAQKDNFLANTKKFKSLQWESPKSKGRISKCLVYKKKAS